MDILNEPRMNDGEWYVSVTREHPVSQKFVPLWALRGGYAPGSDPLHNIGVDALPKARGPEATETDILRDELAQVKAQLALLLAELARIAGQAGQAPRPAGSPPDRKALAIETIRAAAAIRRTTLFGTPSEELAALRLFEIACNAKTGRPDAVELINELARVRNDSWGRMADATIAQHDRCNAAATHITGLVNGAIDDLSASDLTTDEQIDLLEKQVIAAINGIDIEGAANG